MTLHRCFGRPATGIQVALAASLLLIHSSAAAHTQIQGMAHFSGGLLHPLLTPSHVMIVLASGLLLGQQQPLSLATPMWSFASASAVGLFLATLWQLPPQWQALLPIIALGIALLAARAVRVRRNALILLFASSGLLIGLDSGLDNGASALQIAVTSLGTWISLNVVLANTAFYLSLCPPRKWVQIGMRVAGSWIVAICVLVLAFSVKG